MLKKKYIKPDVQEVHIDCAIQLYIASNERPGNSGNAPGHNKGDWVPPGHNKGDWTPPGHNKHNIDEPFGDTEW